MKLSQLVYLCIKNAIYYDDASFTYETFITGKNNGDPDYATNIHNVYDPLNRAISRLNDLDRIPFAIVEVESDNTVFDVSEIKDIQEIISVGAVEKDQVRSLQFVYMYGTKKVKAFSNIYPCEDVFVEYKRRMPQFIDATSMILTDEDTEFAYFQYNPLTGDKVVDVDLNDYGIKYYDYIIEYVKGYLLEPVDPILANLHLTRAEQYIANTVPETSAFAQRVVEKVYEI